MEIQYKIIGGDGREYGPVALEELLSWIGDGRVGGSTQVWRSDLGVWAKADTYAEFAFDLGLVARPAVAAKTPETLPVGFWARLAAFIVDCILLAIISYPVWLLVMKLMGWQEATPPLFAPGVDPSAYLKEAIEFIQKMMPMMLAQKGLQTGIHVIYEVILNGKYGATVGKMIIGAQIVRLDDSPIGYKVAFLRALSRIVSSLPCYAGYLFIPFRKDKRALHDLMVGTKVVYKR